MHYTMGTEVAIKAQVVRSTAKPLYKHVLANRLIDESTRASLAFSLVLSKLMYNVGVWPDLPAIDFRRFHNAVMYVYRAVANKPRSKHTGCSVASVLQGIDVIAPRYLQRMGRILLYARLLVRSHGAIHHCGGFSQRCQKRLDRLRDTGLGMAGRGKSQAR